jgi:hypothetical protein
MEGIGIGAEFGQGRKYRYCLWRIWDLSKPRVMFVGLNPSTANENKNDNTITKVIKIAKNNGFGGIYMTNLFPFVTAYPTELNCNYESNAINDEWLEKIYDKCSKVVFCWGNFKSAATRSREVMKLFVHPMCLAQNKNGSPKHPLYCKDETILIHFNL